MKPLVTVVDYGVGNLFSVSRAFERIGATVELVDSVFKIKNATHLVLPGVGAFADGMAGLHARNLIEPIRRYAESGRPFLGICLGMQMMLEMSEEFGRHEGLGLILGDVRAIPVLGENGQPRKVPHVGWASLTPAESGIAWAGTILASIHSGDSAYFVHSYMANPADIQHRLADTDYDGCRISAAIRHGYLYGCQFHPEKSGPVGLRMLDQFAALVA